MQCLSELSSEKEDLIGKGFNSGSRAKERQCPGGMISVLMDVEDITAKVNAATSGLDSTKANEARKQTLSKLEAACAATGKNDPLVADGNDPATDVGFAGPQSAHGDLFRRAFERTHVNGAVLR